VIVGRAIWTLVAGNNFGRDGRETGTPAATARLILNCDV
jgi:hypothetical protein